VVALSLAASFPGSAAASRTFYGWLYGTEVMPERGVELQSWILEENDLGKTSAHESLFWWGALIGVTDQLELALPLEMTWSEAAGVDRASCSAVRPRARYRFVSQDRTRQRSRRSPDRRQRDVIVATSCASRPTSWARSARPRPRARRLPA
jgi:hypothetical protein